MAIDVLYELLDESSLPTGVCWGGGMCGVRSCVVRRQLQRARPSRRTINEAAEALGTTPREVLDLMEKRIVDPEHRWGRPVVRTVGVWSGRLLVAKEDIERIRRERGTP